MQKCFEKCKVLCRYKVSLCGNFELMVLAYFFIIFSSSSPSSVINTFKYDWHLNSTWNMKICKIK